MVLGNSEYGAHYLIGLDPTRALVDQSMRCGTVTHCTSTIPDACTTVELLHRCMRLAHDVYTSSELVYT